MLRPIFCALSLLIVAVRAAPACTAADIRSMFTACDPSTSMMSSVQYYHHRCDERNQSSVLLQPPRQTPCVRSCQSGEWYSPETIDCEKCPAGSSSNSGGRIINDFTSFPTGFATFCSPAPCNPWTTDASGSFLFSGDQRHLRTDGSQQVDSSLTTIINVINKEHGGLFAFSYRTESEAKYDGLFVVVNGTRLESPTTFLASGFQVAWKRTKFRLPFGVSEVKLVYQKDYDQSSVANETSVGRDAAFVTDILIEGVQMFASSCTPCSAGRFSAAPGSMTCEPCATNTFSTSGAATCEPCKLDEWAPVGSDRCSKRRVCTDIDYVAVYSPCDAKTQHRDLTWKRTNERCIASSPPPKNQTVPCQACMSGMFRDEKTGLCTACPLGQAYLQEAGAKAPKCKQCPAGYAAIPVLEYRDGFDQLDGELSPMFSSTCLGSGCSSPTGFELFQFKDDSDADDHTRTGIRSSLSNGDVFTAELVYEFETVASGYIRFVYGLQHSSRQATTPISADSMVATFTLDGEDSALETNARTVGWKYAKAGKHTARWTFSQTSRGQVDQVAFALLGLTVQGEANWGAATSCSPCRAGHFCPGNSHTMIPCQPGWHQEKTGADVCDNCPIGQVARDSGSVYCQNCPSGTLPSSKQDACMNQCFMRYPNGVEVNLTELRGHVFGPALPSGAPADPEKADDQSVARYYFAPCNHVNDLPQPNLCSFRFGELVQPSYACQRLHANRSYSLGDDVQWVWNRDLQRPSIHISGGTRCSAGVERKTNVSLICSPTLLGKGEFLFVREDPRCSYHFTLTTRYACPICGPGSWLRSEGPCQPNGTRFVSFAKAPGFENCREADTGSSPTDGLRPCAICNTSDFRVLWAACKAGKQSAVVSQRVSSHCEDVEGKVKTQALEEWLEKQHEKRAVRTCTTVAVEVGANPVTFISVFIVLFIVIMIVALVSVYLRHRALQTKYQALSNQPSTVNEMAPVPSADDGVRRRARDPDDDLEFSNVPHGSGTALPRDE